MPILTSEISNSNRFLERFLVFREVLGGETRGEEVKGGERVEQDIWQICILTQTLSTKRKKRKSKMMSMKSSNTHTYLRD
jgi:hypothetical protein